MAEGRQLVDAGGPGADPGGGCYRDLDLRAARLRAERDVLQRALAHSNNTLSVAAKLLGISRPTLYGLMEAHGIEVESGKPAEAAAGGGRTDLE